MVDAQPPTYVISLKHATARQKQVAAQCARLGLNYTLFDGVDGRAENDTLLAKTDVQSWHRNMGAPVVAGHLGCYASHVSLWDKIGASDAPVALICEDDVTFDDAFPRALQSAMDVSDSWDICRFAKIRAKGPVLQQQVGDFALNAYTGSFTGNACYLIKRDLAARLATSFWPITRAHDHELNRFFVHDFKLLGLEPFSAHPQDNAQSFITGDAMSGVQKFPKYQRLPHYFQKLGNYISRWQWLRRQGML